MLVCLWCLVASRGDCGFRGVTYALPMNYDSNAITHGGAVIRDISDTRYSAIGAMTGKNDILGSGDGLKSDDGENRGAWVTLMVQRVAVLYVRPSWVHVGPA
jgi:hypothetical protein